MGIAGKSSFSDPALAPIRLRIDAQFGSAGAATTANE
jgi:hypothetical protein